MMSRSLSRPGRKVQASVVHDATVEGRYANYFGVGHNSLEFLVDFGQLYAGTKAHIHSRVIMSPRYARELLRVLTDSITTYEQQFGAIQDPGDASLEQSRETV